MASTEAEMQYNIARNEDTDRQISSQTFIVKNVGNVNVTLKFINNCFRKHFLLRSKKQEKTSIDDKAAHRAAKRYSVSVQYQNEHDGKKVGGHNQIKRRYGDGTDVSHAIDLTQINIHDVLTRLAVAARAKSDWQPDGKGNIEIRFGTNCVIESTVQPMGIDGKNNIDAVRVSKMTFGMKKDNALVYTVTHAEA